MKLDFNDFKIRGYAPSDVWKAYATLTCYHLGIRQGGSLEQLSQAWDGLKELGCHYTDRIKVIKHILKTKWQRAHDAVENAFLTYTPATHRSPDKVSLETKKGAFDVPFKKWSHGLLGLDITEHTYFDVIIINTQVLIPILREHDVYTGKSFSGSEWLYLEIIDD